MNSSRKGADGERELAAILEAEGFPMQRGGTESYGERPDLYGLPGIHVEVKRVEKLNVLDAMRQAIRDAARFGDGMPTVFHRRNRTPWLVTMLLPDWLNLYKLPKVGQFEKGEQDVTHWKKLTNPDYLGSYILEDGKDLILTIGDVRQEIVTGPEGKREECLVCHWRENQKPMILNTTNAKMIAKLLKSPYIEQWSGKRIQIGSEKVRAFGEIVDALRVRPFLPGAEEIICEKCGKPITGAHGMSAAELAKYTREKYKAALCSQCATEEAKK